MGAPKGNKYALGNTGGQPPKFDSVDKLSQSIEDVIINKSALRNKDFKNEKELKLHLSNNIKSFCSNVLDDEYINHELEYKLTKTTGRIQSKKVDILLSCKNSKYIIELKNPKYPCENTYAIGQLLNYSRYIDGVKLIIASTIYDFDTVRTIKHYKLPISFIYISLDEILIFQKFIDE